MSQFNRECSTGNISFSASVLEDGGNKEWVEMDKRWLEEQRNEFREMDENHDGILTKDELLVSRNISIWESMSVVCLACLRSVESRSYKQSNQEIVF